MATGKIKEIDDDIRRYEIKRKKIVPYIGTISVFVFNNKTENPIAEKIEKDLKERNIIIKRDITDFHAYYDKETRVIDEVDYMVILVSKNFLCDWSLMGILLNNYEVNGENSKIIPLIVDDILYNPIEKTAILKALQEYINKYEKEFFDNNYNGEIADEIRTMQSILMMIKDFMRFSLNRDKIRDDTWSQKIIKYIKYFTGIDVNERRNEPMANQNIALTVNGGQVNVASGNATVNATQNNGVNASELENIIKGIMSNLSDLQKEDADEIADIVEMAKNELTKAEPKASRLRNCLTLIAPMFTIANGIPTLAMHLQKLQEYIMQYI